MAPKKRNATRVCGSGWSHGHCRSLELWPSRETTLGSHARATEARESLASGVRGRVTLTLDPGTAPEIHPGGPITVYLHFECHVHSCEPMPRPSFTEMYRQRAHSRHACKQSARELAKPTEALPLKRGPW